MFPLIATLFALCFASSVPLSRPKPAPAKAGGHPLLRFKCALVPLAGEGLGERACVQLRTCHVFWNSQ